MNIDKNRIQKFIIAFVLLVLLSLVAVYFIYLAPLQNDLAKAKQQLKTEEELYETMLQGKVEAPEMNQEETIEMLKKVPTSPFIENWLVQLEGAENAANVTVQNYSFSKSQFQITLLNEEEEEGDDTSSSSIEQTIHQVNGSLQVTANSFEGLYQFIEELEKLERITKVSSLSFTEPSENEEGSTLSFQVNVSTYYLPDLLEELGELQNSPSFQQPSGKHNPFE
ncbi:type 4a pilus biogenesis protein PilO [Evansella sp. AB-rgal1]|uniref:type 4a pilus biogenesis protein PilO n=1 Tax=Evansella sp. AB-rgal1 TaxID=3242696 RepID=UPI00359E4FD4